MIASVIHGRAGSLLAIGARLWSQTQPQRVEIIERAAAGASHTAALRCIFRKEPADG
jgi:hypothetical protein